MDNELITKLDNYFDKIGLDLSEKLLLINDLSYLYFQCRLKDKLLDEIIADIENEIEDEIEDDIDDDIEDDEIDSPPKPKPRPQPQPRQMSELKQQLGKPIGIKKPQIKINQGEIDRGEF